MIVIDKKTLRLSPNQYYHEATEKSQIYLHHTVGGNAKSTVAWWNSNPEHVGTAYLVGRTGVIYEVFDPVYWCLTGDTFISCVDGIERRIDSLPSGTEFMVYGCNPNGEIRFCKAVSLGKTRESRVLAHITLDNGKTIRCSLDHQFMMRNGSYKRADALSTYDSLMPFYREIDKYGYEIFLDNFTLQYKKTHREVAHKFLDSQISECRSRIPDDRLVIHHKDFDKRNNIPDNLEWMNGSEHIAYHFNHTKETLHKTSYTEDHRKRLAHSAKIDWSRNRVKRDKWNKYVHSEENANRLRELNKIRNKYIGYIEVVRVCEDIIANGGEVTRESYDKIRAEILRRGRRNFPRYDTLLKRFGSVGNAIKEVYSNVNHYVVKVEIVEYPFDVPLYDILVPETNNFAISDGVFVHNCHHLGLKTSENKNCNKRSIGIELCSE